MVAPTRCRSPMARAGSKSTRCQPTAQWCASAILTLVADAASLWRQRRAYTYRKSVQRRSSPITKPTLFTTSQQMATRSLWCTGNEERRENTFTADRGRQRILGAVHHGGRYVSTDRYPDNRLRS